MSKNESASISFVPKQNDYYFNAKCKGGPTQKLTFQEWNTSNKKWVTNKKQSGQIPCSKSKTVETTGGFSVKKGHKYRVYVKNSSNSTIKLTVEHGNGSQG